MAKCNYCGASILIGSCKHDGFEYCNKDHLEKGIYIELSKKIEKNDVEKLVNEIHNGLCPKCKGPGPIDVYTCYDIY